MTKLWTIIAVANVRASTTWYQSLLGLPLAPPAHDYFSQIIDEDESVLLCLHAWGEHDHPSLAGATSGTPGNGLLLFFRVRDFARTLASARHMQLPLLEEPHPNPNTGTMEFSLRDTDGYYVTISALHTD